MLLMLLISTPQRSFPRPYLTTERSAEDSGFSRGALTHDHSSRDRKDEQHRQKDEDIVHPKPGIAPRANHEPDSADEQRRDRKGNSNAQQSRCMIANRDATGAVDDGLSLNRLADRTGGGDALLHGVHELGVVADTARIADGAGGRRQPIDSARQLFHISSFRESGTRGGGGGCGCLLRTAALVQAVLGTKHLQQPSPIESKM